MRRAAEDHTDPIDRLKQAGLAYVTFALRRPEHFAVMFDGPVSLKTEHPGSSDAAKEALALSMAVRMRVNSPQEIRQTLRCLRGPWSMASPNSPSLDGSRFARRRKPSNSRDLSLTSRWHRGRQRNGRAAD